MKLTSPLLASLASLAAPATAFAHAGHEHGASPVVHHLVEGLGLAVLVGVTLYAVVSWARSRDR